MKVTISDLEAKISSDLSEKINWITPFEPFKIIAFYARFHLLISGRFSVGGWDGAVSFVKGKAIALNFELP